jgi:hypothetical protein
MNNVVMIEDYLSGRMETADRLLMEARLLIDEKLRSDCLSQQRVHELAKAYGRYSLQKEIAAVQQQIAVEKKYEDFRQRIKAIFKRYQP